VRPYGRDRSFGSRLRGFVTRLILVALGVLVLAAGGVVLWGGTGRPTAVLDQPVEFVGRATEVSLTLGAGRAGLRSWQVGLSSAGTLHVLAEDTLPRTGLLGGNQRTKDLHLSIDAGKAGIPEGPAELLVVVKDYSALGYLRRTEPALSAKVTVDLTPPVVSVRSSQIYMTLGASDLVLYTAGADAVSSGVQVGKYFFPGESGLFADPTAHAAFFAVPQDLDARVIPKVVAVDQAGNRREVPFPCTIRDKRFPDAEIALTDDFLARKVPELISENNLPASDDLLKGYLLINRDLRKTSEEKLAVITAQSSPRALFDGAFRQQPNSKVVSHFAEHRTYRYKGEVVDQQTHLGYDLASLKGAPVSAANRGEVKFVGNLGIYGNVVVIDHGMGLASLYAHLSSAEVKPGQMVDKNEEIGRTGETGLAGGDHLHFSIMLRGVHIDPVEWWDPKWVRDHVAAQLASLPAASPTTTVGSAAPPNPAQPGP
jgi:murein DD-endopeptidase MepM/ murein hydrolase activator NlpD